jgi:predicted transcriptional regulator
MKRVNDECYRDDIANYLCRNMPLKEIFERIVADGYNGSYSQTVVYCHKLITELGIEYTSRKNSAGVCVKNNQKLDVHCITKSCIFQYIWSDKELELADVVYIIRKYPLVFDIIECVRDFRNIFTEKSEKLLKHFIEKYSVNSIKAIKSFASGLIHDYDAVKNAVVSDLSNGFVEGNHNKVKLIKRSMYGRAGLNLLRAKVISAR